MTATMEERIYERLGILEERSAQTEKAAVARYEAILEKLEDLSHAVHGNGKPGLIDEVAEMKAWRQKVHWMVAGATSLASAVIAVVWFVISGGLSKILSFFSDKQR